MHKLGEGACKLVHSVSGHESVSSEDLSWLESVSTAVDLLSGHFKMLSVLPTNKPPLVVAPSVYGIAKNVGGYVTSLSSDRFAAEVDSITGDQSGRIRKSLNQRCVTDLGEAIGDQGFSENQQSEEQAQRASAGVDLGKVQRVVRDAWSLLEENRLLGCLPLNALEDSLEAAESILGEAHDARVSSLQDTMERLQAWNAVNWRVTEASLESIACHLGDEPPPDPTLAKFYQIEQRAYDDCLQGLANPSAHPNSDLTVLLRTYAKDLRAVFAHARGRNNSLSIGQFAKIFKATVSNQFTSSEVEYMANYCIQKLHGQNAVRVGLDEQVSHGSLHAHEASGRAF